MGDRKGPTTLRNDKREHARNGSEIVLHYLQPNLNSSGCKLHWFEDCQLVIIWVASSNGCRQHTEDDSESQI